MKLGLQLYTIRDAMAENVDAALKKVAECGYDCVEFAGYFDHSAEELKEICDKYHLEIVSVHQSCDWFLREPEAAVTYLKTLGVKYCAVPWVAAARLENEYETVVEELKTVAKLLKENGIQFAYHNHDFELTLKRNGMKMLDSLVADVTEELMQPELDLCWVHYAGSNPCDYIKKYGHVEEIIHIKDFECKNLAAGPVYDLIDKDGKTMERKKDKESDGFQFCPVGKGRQDVKALLDAMKDTKIQYLIVEQDNHHGADPMEDIAESARYLRSLGV